VPFKKYLYSSWGIFLKKMSWLSFKLVGRQVANSKCNSWYRWWNGGPSSQSPCLTVNRPDTKCRRWTFYTLCLYFRISWFWYFTALLLSIISPKNSPSPRRQSRLLVQHVYKTRTSINVHCRVRVINWLIVHTDMSSLWDWVSTL